ncbi:MAG: hypothetical protein PVH68_18860, partial [Armatimonadota bacterium]
MRIPTFSALALCLTALACAGEPPEAGRTDTSALDTHLRRERFPLTVKLIEHSGTGGQSVPLTCGIGCGQGDFPSGTLSPVLNGEAVPAQVNVLATWPRDGSVRHALVSLLLPRIGPNETLTLSFRRAAPPPPEEFRLGGPLDDFVVEAELEGADGKMTLSRVPSATMAEIAGIVAGQAQPGALAPRLAGPICYEFEVHDVPRTDGEPDPDLDIFYRLRLYSGVPGARVACVVENTRMPAEPYPEAFTIADRDFVRLSFRAGP